MKPDLIYKKHIYWITGSEESQLRQTLKEKKIILRSAKGIVCTPLDKMNKITSVAPEVWNDTCERQGCWYRASDKYGLYLIISSFELEGYERKKAATLTKSEFQPPLLPTVNEKEAMIADPDFQTRQPQEWSRVKEVEKRIYLRWAKRLGSGVEDYDFLYLTHTANHANFARPQYYIKEGNLLVPYSIDQSAHLCSCCVELFQILGAQYPKKLVRPCPGACIFAGLTPDEYLLVENNSCFGESGSADAVNP